MSSTEAPPLPGGTASTTTTPKQYFCHKCNQTITVNQSPSTEPFCPTCHECFIEELETPQNPNPLSDPPFSSDLLDPFSSLLSLLFQNPSNSSQPGFSTRSELADPNAFNSVDFLRSHLQNLQTGGARIQFVIENNPTHLGPQNLGDYFIGSGLEQLIQQLAENDPNRYGTPPAAKSAIESLPTIRVDEEMMNSEMNQCAVCKDELQKGEDVKSMPCKHVFHDDCIMPWLKLHNSCPVCRYELPTDDEDYENRMRGGGQGSGGRNGGGGERRFSISFPWMFGGERNGDSSGGGQSSG